MSRPDGMRVVIEIKRDAAGDVILDQLYRHTRCKPAFRSTKAMNWQADANGIERRHCSILRVSQSSYCTSYRIL